MFFLIVNFFQDTSLCKHLLPLEKGQKGFGSLNHSSVHCNQSWTEDRVKTHKAQTGSEHAIIYDIETVKYQVPVVR